MTALGRGCTLMNAGVGRWAEEANTPKRIHDDIGSKVPEKGKAADRSSRTLPTAHTCDGGKEI